MGGKGRGSSTVENGSDRLQSHHRCISAGSCARIKTVRTSNAQEAHHEAPQAL